MWKSPQKTSTPYKSLWRQHCSKSPTPIIVLTRKAATLTSSFWPLMRTRKRMFLLCWLAIFFIISTERCSIHSPTRRFPSNPSNPPTYSTTVLHPSLTCYWSWECKVYFFTFSLIRPPPTPQKKKREKKLKSWSAQSRWSREMGGDV